MAQLNMQDKWVTAQHKAIASFVEFEQEIRANSLFAQSLKEQTGATLKSLQEEVDEIIEKEKTETIQLHALEKIQVGALAGVKRQQCLFEVAVISAGTLVAKTSESGYDVYCGTRLKDICRVPQILQVQGELQQQKSPVVTMTLRK